MKILNEANEEIADPDLTLGHLKDDTEKIHHEEIPAVEGVPPKVHYETIAEYPNGGKDVKEIIDEEGVEGHAEIPAWDEDSPIQRYILYTAEELKAIADAKAEAERLAALPTVEERLKATEDALMAIMIGGNSNV
jgi:hypothetical protein